jgi:hypothetical protein
LSHQSRIDVGLRLSPINVTDESSNSPQRSTYEDLTAGEQLNGSTIADTVQVIIEMSNVGKAVFAPDPSLEERVRINDYDNLIQQSFKRDLYEFDIILQQMWVDSKSHYVLGGIIFKTKIVFIMDSIRKPPRDRVEDFNILLKIAAASVSTSGEEFCTESWQCVYATDSPLQKNSFDCGLYCAANVFTIVNNKKFNELPFSSSTDGRSWMKSLLTSNKYTPVKSHRGILVPPDLTELIMIKSKLAEIKIWS